MKVAFVLNQIDNRGTGNAVFDYAHYNETILKNESIIVSLNGEPPDIQMAAKIFERFGPYYTIWDLISEDLGIDVIYHIKGGGNDGSLGLAGARYVVHAVFDGSQPHGDRYATISRWMGDKYGIPYVPHIVNLEIPTYDVRLEYNIPKDAIVFGRHGGSETFDITWAWETVDEVSRQHENVYFLFLNTNPPDMPLNNQVIFIPATANSFYKSSFIHACDAMLHARSRGESFGISVGEFAVAGKPVLTYGACDEKAHIEELASSQCYLYFNKDQLRTGIDLVRTSRWKPWNIGYTEYTPERVMQKFKEIFLD